MKTSAFLLIALALVVALSSCRGDEAAATATPDPDLPASSDDTPAPAATEESAGGEVIYGEATIDSIQLLTLESFPVQINARVRGELADGCTSIDEISSERSGNAFRITVTTARDADAICTAEVVPFEETISLDVEGLDAGSYTVSVNSSTGSFTLDMDNRIPEEAPPDPTPEPTPTPTPEPEPEPADSNAAAIHGRIWHDLCAVTVGGGDEEAEPSEGCIATVDGAFQANGLMEEDEPGIKGIEVALLVGECPSADQTLDTTTTDENGEYAFTSLGEGTYCVSVDSLSEQNSDILLPGGWTAPEANVSSTTVELDSDQNQADVNFGWDYQFLPIPEVDPEICTNSIEYIEDLTIPDDTVFAPGEEFVKTWRLGNNGTCPWTAGYSLVFVGGDGIPGPDSVPLTEPVAPGQTVELSVALTAPEEPGTYRDNWQISDASGEPFGIDGFIEDAFWLQIVVEAPVEPNSAVIGGVVWDDFCRLLEDGSLSGSCVETETDSGIFRADGTLNPGEARLSGVVVTLSANACPADGPINPGNVIETTTTDEDGLYRFTNLVEGTYCVDIDALSEDNVNLLIPGNWTWPAPGTGRYGILLAAGEERLEADFGWDYR